MGQTCNSLRRMIHTVDEVDSVIFANREKLKIDKGAQDFSRRIAKMSGVGDKNAAPDGTCSVPLPLITLCWIESRPCLPEQCAGTSCLPVWQLPFLEFCLSPIATDY